MIDTKCESPCEPIVPKSLGDFPDINGGSGTEPTPFDQPLTNEQLRAAAVPVSGPLTNAQFIAVQGTAAIAAWSGAGAGTTIAILKAMYAQNVELIGQNNDIKTQNDSIIALLGTIATNTTPIEP